MCNYSEAQKEVLENYDTLLHEDTLQNMISSCQLSSSLLESFAHPPTTLVTLVVSSPLSHRRRRLKHPWPKC